MTTKVILFKNSFLEVNGVQMTMMYFYKDFFFLQTSDDGIAILEKENFQEKQLKEIMENTEQQDEIEDDPKLIELLDNILAKIKEQEGGDNLAPH